MTLDEFAERARSTAGNWASRSSIGFVKLIVLVVPMAFVLVLLVDPVTNAGMAMAFGVCVVPALPVYFLLGNLWGKRKARRDGRANA